MKQDIHKQFVAVLIVLAVLAGVAVADSATLKEKLAQDVDIELTDVTMAEALEQIGQRTGITIELTDEAAWRLPAGMQTRLSVTLEGQLAQGLEQMLNEFFLRYAVGSDSVVIFPRPELSHIFGRPTPRLLKLLKRIYTSQMQIAVRGGNSESVAQGMLNALAGEPVTVLPMNEFNNASAVLWNIGQRAPSGMEGKSTVPATTSVTLATILDETVSGRSSTIWYISEPDFPDQPVQIHIDSRRDYAQALFGQIVDVSFQDEDGLTVLRKLAGMGNIDLHIIGEQEYGSEGFRRKISVEALNVSVRQALDRVTYSLGAQVAPVRSDGADYYVTLPTPTPTPVASQRPVQETEVASAPPSVETPPADDDYVGKISIPMGEGQNRYYIEFMLRERDLPDALKQLRAEKIREIFESFSDSVEAN